KIKNLCKEKENLNKKIGDEEQLRVENNNLNELNKALQQRIKKIEKESDEAKFTIKEAAAKNIQLRNECEDMKYGIDSLYRDLEEQKKAKKINFFKGLLLGGAVLSLIWYISPILTGPPTIETLYDDQPELSVEDMYKKGKESEEIGDYAEAVKWYRKAAEQGHAGAQKNLGGMYQNGQGVSQDYLEAVKWYKKAAEQGSVEAQTNLGWLYDEGKGVSQDYSKAVKWYREAAKQGYAEAQTNLGWMYENGKGVSQDYPEALKWYWEAAKQGYAEAQTNLGWMYEKGKGIPKNYSEAVKWYRKAAEQGEATAQNNLGAMYQEGIGVSKDLSEAVKWYQKAAKQGEKTAQENLKKLEGIMTNKINVGKF
ncbi:tetratricopeptide repeat protein, partial [Capnocytophaga granulosa]